MNRLDLFTFKIDPSSRVERFFLNCLAPAERARASSFKTTELSRLAIIARGLLRHILSPYAGVSPADVEFTYNAYGKPFLKADGKGPAPAGFNMSHSGDFLAIAVSEGSRVGLDIECDREVDGFGALFDRFLTASERKRLTMLPERLRPNAFLKLWTWKEAALKASGIGLSLDPARVEVGEDSVLLDFPDELASWDFPGRLYVSDISVAGMFHGALATDAADGRTRLLANCRDPEEFLGSA